MPKGIINVPKNRLMANSNVVFKYKQNRNAGLVKVKDITLTHSSVMTISVVGQA